MAKTRSELMHAEAELARAHKIGYIPDPPYIIVYDRDAFQNWYDDFNRFNGKPLRTIDWEKEYVTTAENRTASATVVRKRTKQRAAQQPDQVRKTVGK